MKKYGYCLLALLFCLGCENDKKLTFEKFEINNQDCSDCPKVQISIPQFLGNSILAHTINNSLREEISYFLNFETEHSAENIAGAIASFVKAYHDFAEEFPDDAQTLIWEAQVDAKVVFENERLVTVEFKSFSYTGGAHGYEKTVFLSFDKKKGKELENWQLFKDYEGFEKLVETKFRKQENIPEAAQINDTGFMFNQNQFHLSENMGFTKKGVQLVYNSYEVASYADGPIILTITFEKANVYLKYTVEP